MKKFSLWFLIFIALMLFWYGESRRFLCLDDKRCITVWKTYNDICYIMPGKYYGLLRPLSGNYIRTSNLSDLDVIWQPGGSSIIVNVDDRAKIVNQALDQIEIIDYNINKVHNDSVFTFFDGKYRRYKKGVDFISIDLRENYAVDKDGKHL